jgi:hypothetical protein
MLPHVFVNQNFELVSRVANIRNDVTSPSTGFHPTAEAIEAQRCQLGVFVKALSSSSVSGNVLISSPNSRSYDTLTP